MTIDVFIQRIDTMQEYFRSGAFQNDVLVYGALDMAARIGNRVRETGILGSGNSFSYKSEQYKKKREKKGLRTDVKNYSFTTEMWSGFGVKNSKQNYVELGGKTPTSQDKINWNTRTDGDVIIAPNEAEQQKLTDFVNKKIKEAINAALSRR